MEMHNLEEWAFRAVLKKALNVERREIPVETVDFNGF